MGNTISGHWSKSKSDHAVSWWMVERERPKRNLLNTEDGHVHEAALTQVSHSLRVATRTQKGSSSSSRSKHSGKCAQTSSGRSNVAVQRGARAFMRILVAFIDQPSRFSVCDADCRMQNAEQSAALGVGCASAASRTLSVCMCMLAGFRPFRNALSECECRVASRRSHTAFVRVNITQQCTQGERVRLALLLLSLPCVLRSCAPVVRA